MARITSQKAIQALGGNQFLLINIAAHRARQLSTGRARPLVDTKNDKWSVVAIREIEEGKYTEQDYRDDLNGVTKEIIEKDIEDEY